MKIYKQQLALKKTETLIEFEGKISSSRDSYKLAKAIWNWDDVEILERFYAAFLSSSNTVVSFVELSVGGQNATVVDIKLLMGHAILAVTKGMIVFHNHPSGSVQPSQNDVAITKRIKQVCELHDIALLDHMIIAESQYYSFADEGVL